ncbi:MAG: hypothetical protein HFE62_05030 [Firmicutes bacterium]|nr:hypothetical protein [Bacillota bacterium]
MEWQVITVIVTIAGLFFTVAKPIIKLTSTISKLDQTCSRLDGQFSGFEARNKESHRRIWEHNGKQDDAINDHEKRITYLEKEGEK